VRASTTLIVFAAGIVAGCGRGPADVAFTFDNRTDAILCDYTSPPDATAARCNTELKPQAATGGGRDCDNQESRPVRVIITVKQGGRQIYDRTASCGAWADTKRRFVIEQRDGEFIVTDSLPNSTAGP
jgi:hypothetical protein